MTYDEIIKNRHWPALNRLTAITDETESEIVHNFLKDCEVKRFLEIGSNSAKMSHNLLSPSWELLQSGWHGVLCEPDPHAGVELIKCVDEGNLSDNVTIFNGGITLESKISEFHLALGRSSISSFDQLWVDTPDISNSIKKSKQFTILANTLSFQDFLNKMGNDFSYIITDVEGLDLALIESIEWDQFPNLKLLCTEAPMSVAEHMYKYGFKLVKRTSYNTYYTKYS